MEMKIPKLGWLAKEKAAWEQRDPAGSRADRKARNREKERWGGTQEGKNYSSTFRRRF